MIINNVKLVLENEVVHGSLEVQDGEIRAFAESQSRLPEAMDGEGGWLLPGLIELHTDNLDKFFTPRPKVDWPAHSAMSSHDALMVASGITTVLDAQDDDPSSTHQSQRSRSLYFRKSKPLIITWGRVVLSD